MLSPTHTQRNLFELVRIPGRIGNLILYSYQPFPAVLVLDRVVASRSPGPARGETRRWAVRCKSPARADVYGGYEYNIRIHRRRIGGILSSFFVDTSNTSNLDARECKHLEEVDEVGSRPRLREKRVHGSSQQLRAVMGEHGDRNRVRGHVGRLRRTLRAQEHGVLKGIGCRATASAFVSVLAGRKKAHDIAKVPLQGSEQWIQPVQRVWIPFIDEQLDEQLQVPTSLLEKCEHAVINLLEPRVKCSAYSNRLWQLVVRRTQKIQDSLVIGPREIINESNMF